ncbi:aromatic acid exporter family protein [Citricoccus sp.]|uniref:FUSC family protein n=1 Tax=Citricoccus sp. TaxID=1978372 RepID=UPI0028BE713F|nr:aromatic acid exporter family protein [Citricoccus sp.]
MTSVKATHGGQRTHGLADRLLEIARRPTFLSAITQTIKCVIAATAAWWFSITVLETQMPFLAPWTALLTVHATVYRSLSHGVQTSIASALGVGLSFVIGNLLGVNVWTYALALLVGMVAARIHWIRDEGIAIATTAIFLLSSGFEDQEPLLLDRMIEVGVGVAVGIAVNLLIIPPLRDRQAASYVDSINRRMGSVLEEMADEFSQSWDTDRAEAWMSETGSMEDDTRTAWEFVRFARESRRANPRMYLRRHGVRLRTPLTGNGKEDDYVEILSRVDEGVSHLRHLARTLHEATYAEGAWNDRFRDQWSMILRDCGRSIADPDAEVEPVNDRLTDLSESMSQDHDLPRSAWPVYGSLITSLRHLAVIVDDVASTRKAREASA